MPDLGILNTIIAMVVVILVLSLIVQSLQTLVKKFFKLKSRTLHNSLLDLFETITQNPEGGGAPTEHSQQLLANVTERLKEMGRETLFGRTMLDSLAKGDLLKVLTRVEAESLLPGAVGSFQKVLGSIDQLKTELKNVNAQMLEGDASAKFAALQAAVMPLVHDLEALASGGNINPKVMLGDLYRLRQIKAGEVFELLGQIQQKVGADVEAAGKANDAAQTALADARKTNDAAQVTEAEARASEAAGRLFGVRAVADSLKRIAEQITALGRAFDAAFAPLRERLSQAEVWYDTVMQGFEERYTRHMRTVAIVLSILVVVVLNANFFTIYQAMRTPATAERVANQGQGVLDKSKAMNGTQGGTTASPANTNSNAGATSAQTPPADDSTTTADLKKQGQETKGLIDTYQSFGITPLTRQELSNFFAGRYRLHDVSGTFFGWIIMVILLSAGAPFWQDTLESLFGLKNLLRQKSDTKNVEGDKGGNPKP